MPRRTDLNAITKVIGNIGNRLRKIETSVTLTPVKYTVAHSSFLMESTGVGDTTIEIGSFPAWADGDELWVLIGAGGVDCEIRKVQTISGPQLAFATPLAYAHNETDSVVFVEEPIFNVKYWGAKGDDSTTAMWVAGGATGNTLAYSYDGINWVGNGVGGAPDDIFDIEWNGSIWVAVGTVGVDKILYSLNGIAWVGLGAGIFSQAGYKVKWCNGRFVAVGSGVANTIADSTNGIAWTGRGVGIFSSEGDCIECNGAIWVAGGQGATNTMAYSYDGINWVGLGKTVFSTACWKLAWNGYMWVAMGQGTNSIAYSMDGINWTGLGTSIFSVRGFDIMWNGSMWVAVGQGVAHTIAYSYDGISWTGCGVAVFDTAGVGLGWNGSKWVAVGTAGNTVADSTDGIAWTGRGTTIDLAGLGIEWNGHMWVAVGQGNVNTMAYSYDGINWVGLGVGIFSLLGHFVKWSGGDSDDYLPIQRAINQIDYLDYGAVYIPAGTYKINGAINVSFDNLRIYGDGMYETILHFVHSSFTHCLTGSGVASGSLHYGIQIDNLQIYGNKSAHSTVVLRWFSRVILNRLYLRGCYGYGIWLQGCDRVDITYNRIYDFDYWGIVLQPDGGGALVTRFFRITNNRIETVSLHGAFAGGGIYCYSGFQFSMIANVVEDVQYGAYGYYLDHCLVFVLGDNSCLNSAGTTAFTILESEDGAVSGNLSSGNGLSLNFQLNMDMELGANCWTETANPPVYVQTTSQPRIKLFDREKTIVTALQLSITYGAPTLMNVGVAGANPQVWQLADLIWEGVGVWLSPTARLFGASHVMYVRVNFSAFGAGGNFLTYLYVDPVASGGSLVAPAAVFQQLIFANAGSDINNPQIYGPFSMNGMSLLRVSLLRDGGNALDTSTALLYVVSMTFYWD